MISFNQYCSQKPSVLFGIHVNRLEEEFKEISDYMYYHGSNQVHPEGNHIGSGIYELHDGTYQHANGTKFKNIESAELYATSKKKQYLKNLEDLHNDLANKHSYSDRQDFHIQQYTNDSKRLNEALLKNKELSMTHHSVIKHLEDILSEKKAPKDLVVYSGTNLFHANKIRSHDVVEHPSYLSTSLALPTASTFAANNQGDIIKIHVPEGHPAAYIGHISQHKGERELLLPKGLKLRIHHDKREYHLGPRGSSIIHHATIENE